MKLKKPKMAIKPIDTCLVKSSEGTDWWKELVYLKAQCLGEMGDKQGSQKNYALIYAVALAFKDVSDLI